MLSQNWYLLGVKKNLEARPQNKVLLPFWRGVFEKFPTSTPVINIEEYPPPDYTDYTDYINYTDQTNYNDYTDHTDYINYTDQTNYNDYIDHTLVTQTTMTTLTIPTKLTTLTLPAALNTLTNYTITETLRAL